jgi:hypothetical protein
MSGLALELYSTSELPAAYWYAARVLAADAEVLDALVPVTIESKGLYFEVSESERLMLCRYRARRAGLSAFLCPINGLIMPGLLRGQLTSVLSFGLLLSRDHR